MIRKIQGINVALKARLDEGSCGDQEAVYLSALSVDGWKTFCVFRGMMETETETDSMEALDAI